ncbi:MAG: polysaccharide deacetylase family protein [Lachnospirales bacterium]
MKKVFFLAIILIVTMIESVHTATNTAKIIETYTNINSQKYEYTAIEINGDSYIQIEDLAIILKGKENGFNVEVNDDVYNITKNANFTGSQNENFKTDIERPFYNLKNQSVKIGGINNTFEVAEINECNFFEMQELLDKIGLNYEWDAENNTYSFLDSNNNEEAYMVMLPRESAKKVIRTMTNSANIDPSKPMIALTFDDGPKIGNTERIVEALEKTNSRATFFVVGKMVEQHPELVKLAYDAGCQIGNHTYEHINLTNVSADEVKSQIYKTSNIVYDITGEYTMVGRPPYGSINDNVRNCISIPWYNWSIDTLDWKNRDADYVKKYVLDNAEDGDVILMHDLHSTTADAMVECIPELVNRGFQLVTMDELVKFKYDGDVSKVPGYVK